ncbi:MAG: condensation domain-containing protein, partial [Cellvibrio sp.]
MSTSQTATNIEDIYPLSPLQQGMLFQTLLHENSGVYLMQDRYQMSGTINIDAFLDAWRTVIKMHPALRASFVWKTREQPLQAIHKQVKDSVEFIDISELTPEQREAFIQNIFKEEQRIGFNLAKPPLIRVRLVKLAENTYELVRSFHHILMDAWCISLVMVDFINVYDALRQGNEPVLRKSRPFRDYIAWLKGRDYSKDEAFWKTQLQGLDTPTPLVIEQAARRNQYSDAVLVEDTIIHLSAEQTQKLGQFCQSSRITPNTLFQGAWGLLLAGYTGHNEVLFGVTVAGRPPELHGVEEMVGLFINTLPLRVSLDENLSLVPWLQSLQLRNLELREFEHSSLVDIQGWSDFPRGQELFDSILVYENAPMDNKLISGDFISFNLDNMDHSVHTHYGLTVVILPGEQLGIRISYDCGRFNRASVDRLLGHLRQLVVGMLEQPTAKLGALDLLTTEEHQQLRDWNKSQHDFPLDQTYAHLFAQQAAAQPKKIAAVCGDESFTYAELDARSSRLAKVLVDAGVGPDVIVAVLAERSLAFLTSVIAIFKAGAAYLPLEVKHPVQRLADVLNLSQPPVLMTNTAHVPLASEISNHLAQQPRILDVETIWQHGPVPAIEPRGTTDDLAYVIFTSGSTGTPKGALVEQRGMLNNIFGKVPALGLGETDRIAQTASVAFDISVWQLLAAPLTGGTVYILPDSASQNPAQLLTEIEHHQLTLLEAVPVVIRGLLTVSTQATKLPSLRWLLPTGEALPPTLCREWFARFPAIPL